MSTLTPAELADFLETNPRKARGAFQRGTRRCALGWASHLNGGSTPSWVYDGSGRPGGEIATRSDSTPGWSSVIAYLRTLTRHGNPKRVRSEST